MAEVVEINIISKNLLNLDNLLNFVHDSIDTFVENKTIESMDNWEYENSIQISPDEIENCIVNNKIVCITEKINEGYVGINIERVEGGLNYSIWFNQNKYEDLEEYCNLIKFFLAFINQKNNSAFELCAIGKEVIFEYENDINSLLRNSHNIDIWINLDIELTDKLEQQYERININDNIVLKTRSIDII